VYQSKQLKLPLESTLNEKQGDGGGVPEKPALFDPTD
jgi:hypothetical protein